MPFVKRSSDGSIVAISQETGSEFAEEVDANDEGLRTFVMAMSKEQMMMTESDLDFVRVVEDLVELLVSKNYILFTELPAKAQEKMRARQALRGKMSSRLDLLSDDDDNFF